MTQNHPDRPDDQTGSTNHPGSAPPPPPGQHPQAGYRAGYPQPGQQAAQHPGRPGGYGTHPVGGDERTMMMIAHLSAPVSFVVSGAWLPFLGPLLVWLFYKDKSPAVRTAAAGAFNFNISMTIASVLTWISVFLTLGIGFLWAIPIWIAIFVIQLWVHIKGALQASEGRVYQYPFQIRILS